MVPDVVGMTQTDAETAIIGAELTVGTVTEQFSDTVAAGNVMSQTPGAGSTASPGTAVNLVISKGTNDIAISISCNGGTTTTPTKAGGDTMVLSAMALALLVASKFRTT